MAAKPKTTTEEEAPAEAEATPTSLDAAFGDDALGRVQGILFGDQARKTRERIDTLEQALLGVIDDLRSDVSAQIEALDGRISAESETRTTAMRNLTGRLDAEIDQRTDQASSIRADLVSSSEQISDRLMQAETDSRTEFDKVRADLATQDASLRHGLVDRASLAQLFASASEQLGDDSSSRQE